MEQQGGNFPPAQSGQQPPPQGEPGNQATFAQYPDASAGTSTEGERAGAGSSGTSEGARADADAGSSSAAGWRKVETEAPDGASPDHVAYEYQFGAEIDGVFVPAVTKAGGYIDHLVSNAKARAENAEG